MLPSALFLSGLLLHPGGLLGRALPPPDPSLAPVPVAMDTGTLRLVHDPIEPLDRAVVRDLLLAQRRGPRHPAPAPTPPPASEPDPLADPTPSTPAPAPAPAPAPTATAETPAATTDGSATCADIDCDAYHEAEHNSSYVLHRRTSILRTHRAFAIAAWSAMVLTEALGTIQAINQDTWFGRGACAGNPQSFGCQDSSLITGLHESLAFVTEGLYTTAAVLAIAAPDPENASVGDGTAESTLRLHKTLAWIHGTGMVILPLLGILSMTPQMFGVTSDQGRADFSRAIRSIHTIVGYGTFAALTFAGYLELF